jgi:hypothetical protein
MERYKRNQVEKAISSLLEPAATEASPELRTRLKRLLEVDRALGRTPHSDDPARANYAFYSSKPQGSGVEVWFSTYEAFALLNGLRLLKHGWPQGLAVQITRRIRNQLEKHLTRILNQDPEILFDQAAIRRDAQEGGFAADNTDPTFIVVVTRSGTLDSSQGPQLHDSSVIRGAKAAWDWAFKASDGVGVYTMFEIVNLAHRFADQLTRTAPRNRGRSS